MEAALSTVNKLASRLVDRTQSLTRFHLLSILAGCSALVLTVAIRPRVREAKQTLQRRGIFMQSLFSVRDLGQAIALSLSSSSARNMMIAAFVVAYGTKALGGVPAKRNWTLFGYFLGLNYVLYYNIMVVEVPVVKYHRTFWNVSVVEKARLDRRLFFPVFWMTNRHLQTVLGAIFADLVWLLRPPLMFEREEIPAYDGNMLHLDWYINTNYEDPDRSNGDGLTVQAGPRRVESLTEPMDSLDTFVSASTTPQRRMSFTPGMPPRDSMVGSSLVRMRRANSWGRSMDGDIDDENTPSKQFAQQMNAEAMQDSPRFDAEGPDNARQGGWWERRESSMAHAAGRHSMDMDETAQSSDGDEDGLPTNAPILIVLHGIGGSRDDPYVKRLLVTAAGRAWRSVVYAYWRLEWMDPRDMKAVVEHVAQRYPTAPLFAVAFSAGGHLLASYLSAVGKNTPLVAAVSVAGCFDFVRTFDYVEQMQSPMYASILTSNMNKCRQRHVENDMRMQKFRHIFDPISTCVRANVLYDRHIALLPEFTGMKGTRPGPPDFDYAKTSLEPPTEDPGPVMNDANIEDSEASLANAWQTGEAATTDLHSSLYHTAGGITIHPGTTVEERIQDEEWWRGIQNPYDCQFPLPANRGHYLFPARLTVDTIAITTLLMHSRDDPIVSHDDCYDWGLIAKNKHIISVRTDRGGHLGWFDGLFPAWSTSTFADRLVVDFLSAVLEQHAQTNFLASVISKMEKQSLKTFDSDQGFTPGQFARILSSADLEMPNKPVPKPRRNSFTSATNLAANLTLPTVDAPASDLPFSPSSPRSHSSTGDEDHFTRESPHVNNPYSSPKATAARPFYSNEDNGSSSSDEEGHPIRF